MDENGSSRPEGATAPAVACGPATISTSSPRNGLAVVAGGARVCARLEGWAAGLMVRDARLRGLTMRASLALRTDLPPWQIKSGHWGCDKSTRRANHF